MLILILAIKDQIAGISTSELYFLGKLLDLIQMLRLQRGSLETMDNLRIADIIVPALTAAMSYLG